MMKRFLIGAMAVMALFATGCGEKSSSEKAGDAMDEAGDSMEEAADDVGDAVKDATDG